MRLSMAAVVVIISSTISAPRGAAAEEPEKRDTGFYLVHAKAPTPEALPAPTGEQWITRYDSKFLRDEERDPPVQLLLGTRPDVPLRLAKAPVKAKGTGGRTTLLIEVQPDTAATLERVSREHIGDDVAFIIDGEVVSTHTIRSAITGGSFTLSRCTDNACDVIYARLVER